MDRTTRPLVIFASFAASLVVGLVIDYEDVDAALARGHVRAPRAFLGGHARGEVDVDRLRH